APREVGQDLGDEIEDALRAEDEALAQVLHLAGAEIRRPQKFENPAAAHHPVGEDLVDGGILDDREPEDACLFLEHTDHARLFGGDLDRLFVELHVRLPGEVAEDRLEDLAWEPPLELAPDEGVDGEVVLAQAQPRALHPAGCHGAQCTGERRLRALPHQDPMEQEPRGRAPEAITDGRGRLGHGGQLAPLFQGATGGDHCRGHVEACTVARGAVAGPVAATEVEGDAPSHPLPWATDAKDEGIPVGRLQGDRPTARELHPARPGVSGSLLPHCLEELLQHRSHRQLSLSPPRAQRAEGGRFIPHAPFSRLHWCRVSWSRSGSSATTAAISGTSPGGWRAPGRGSAASPAPWPRCAHCPTWSASRRWRPAPSARISGDPARDKTKPSWSLSWATSPRTFTRRGWRCPTTRSTSARTPTSWERSRCTRQVWPSSSTASPCESTSTTPTSPTGSPTTAWRGGRTESRAGSAPTSRCETCRAVACTSSTPTSACRRPSPANTGRSRTRWAG